MCGIIGFVGKKSASPILLEGLRRLEYRGYDSAGVALLHEGSLLVRKKKGKINDGLARLLKSEPVKGSLGIGHTRWATHGAPSDKNSHPHLDQSGKISVVHNGVIENYDSIKQKLLNNGHVFKSDTDTEILAHLIGEYYEKRRTKNGWGEHPREPKASDGSGLSGASPHQTNGNGENPLTLAVCDALREVIGTYGLAVICAEQPNTIVTARRGSPLIIGIGNGENFIASDANAIVAHTKKVVYLNDYDVATITPERFDVLNLGTDTANVQISKLEFDAEDAQRGKHAHFMLKEIYEQPQTIANAVRGRLDFEGATARFGGLNMSIAELRGIERIVIAASGTSWHAALVGEYLIEELAQIPVEVEFAHEFCYRHAPLERDTVLLVLSQSGETADTLAALREAKRRGHRTLAIVNVVGSTIARESDGGIYMHAGPEVAVASTKAFTCTLLCTALLALNLGRVRDLSAADGKRLIAALGRIPDQIRQVLAERERIRQVAVKYMQRSSAFFIGRTHAYPVALEGAQKLKEISYRHAEAYQTSELKHGPLALISPDVPTVAIVPNDELLDRNIGALHEIAARSGPLYVVTHPGVQVPDGAAAVIVVPKNEPELDPILLTIPLQLLAYHASVALGHDVDKPRNLAKSVTVE